MVAAVMDEMSTNRSAILDFPLEAISEIKLTKNTITQTHKRFKAN